MSDFARAFAVLTSPKIEGEWANAGWDNGGRTRWGISSRAYPSVNLDTLTLDGAARIYRSDFWDHCSCDDFPWVLAFPLFDGAVNHGLGNAIPLFQKALGVVADGKIGTKTKQAAARADQREVLINYLAFRALLYVAHEDWGKAGKGWMRRLFRVQQEALQGV